MSLQMNKIIIMTLFHVLVTSIALRAQAIPLATNYYIKGFWSILKAWQGLTSLNKARQGSTQPQ